MSKVRGSNLLASFFLFVPIFLFSDAVGTLPELVRETNLFLLGTVAVGLAVYQCFRRRLFPRDPLVTPILLLLVALGLPILSAVYPWDALRGWTLVLIGGILYFAVARTSVPAGEDARLLRILSLCALGVLTYALYRHYHPPTAAQIQDFLDESLLTDEMRAQMLFAMLTGRAKALFGNPNHLAAFANLLAAAPLVLLLAGRGLGWRVLGGLCAGLHVWLLYLTGSRAGMLAFAGACAVTALLWLRMHRAGSGWLTGRLLGMVAVVLTLGCGLFLLLGGVRLIRPFLYTETLETRIVWWSAAADLILSSPPWGQGLRMFALHFPNIREIGAPESQFVHNLHLELALAGGPLALAGLLWLQVSAYRTAWKLAGSARHGEGLGILAAGFAVTAFWIHAGFDFIQEQSEIVLPFWFYLGLLGSAAGRASGHAIRMKRLSRIVGAAALLSAWIILVVIPWQGNGHLAEGKAALEERRPNFDRSNRELAAAARRLPLSSVPHYFLAHNLGFTTGDPQAAIASMREAIRRNPFMPHYHATMAEMLWAAGEREEALPEIGLAIDLHRAKPDYYFQRSRYRAELGDGSGASRDRERGEIRRTAEAVWTPDVEKLTPRP